MARLEQDGIRRHLEAVAVQVAQRLHDGGDEIGAAADRLGEDHVGPLAGLQTADLGDQVVEAAAEAGAGHFLDGEALGTQARGIDEVLRLIVGDQADALAALHVVTGQPAEGRRLAGAEEATDHYETQAGHAGTPRSYAIR